MDLNPEYSAENPSYLLPIQLPSPDLEICLFPDYENLHQTKAFAHGNKNWLVLSVSKPGKAVKTLGRERNRRSFSILFGSSLSID